MTDPLRELTVDKAHEGYKSGSFTIRQVVQYFLDRIESVDKNGPKINSILGVSSTALAEADELDAQLKSSGQLRGSLYGIPVIVKDQAATKDLATTYGSITAKDNIPTVDATVIAKLKAAGAIILAKSTMPDWATAFNSASSMSGITLNPYDLKRDPGGSSSGTGSAIAADLGILGLGEDTGGSIRCPSSFCGLVGLRATPGMISRTGLSPLLVPQDTAGPMCRTVRDAALMFDAMVGFDPKDQYTTASIIGGQPKGGSYAVLDKTRISSARIGVLKSLFGEDSNPDYLAVNKVVKGALDQLQKAGATLVEIELPNLLETFTLTFTYASRSGSDLDNFFKNNPQLNLTVKKIFESKQYHPTLDLFEDIAVGPGSPVNDPIFTKRLLAQGDLQRLVMSTLASHNLDVLAFPDVKLASPLISDVLKQRWSGSNFPVNTLLASQAVLPAITVPAGLTEEGLPVGLEMVSYPYREQLLLELAYGVEDVVQGRKPPSAI